MKFLASFFQRHEIAALKDALRWASGASDFAPDGLARKGWEKICAPLVK